MQTTLMASFFQEISCVLNLFDFTCSEKLFTVKLFPTRGKKKVLTLEFPCQTVD